MTTAPPHPTATASTGTAPAAELTGARRGVDTAFVVLTVVVMLGLFLQIYFAGAGAFAHRSGVQAVHDPFALHVDLGHYLGVASGVLFVLALIARPNRSTVYGSLALVLLIEVAQEGLAMVGRDNRWYGGLHAFDGVLILLLGVWLCLTSVRRRLVRRGA